MFDVASSIEGAKALTKIMDAVSNEVKYKGGRAALRKAADLVAGAVKANAQRLDDPKTAEQISENVAVRWSPKKFKRSGDLMFRVGLLGGAQSKSGQGEFAGKGKSNPGGDTWYWRLLEFGTRNMQAHPFMRPALEKNTQAATAEFVRQAKRSIESAAKKAAKGNK